MPVRIVILLIILTTLKLAKAADKDPEKMYFGYATADCACKEVFVGDETPLQVNKGEYFGASCRQEKDQITCDPDGGPFKDYVCPSKCAKMVEQTKLTKSVYLKNLMEVEKSGRKLYAEKVPKKVFDAFKKKFPTWWPAFLNSAPFPAYQTNFRIETSVYLQSPVTVENKLVDLSVIYFYNSVDQILEGNWHWSFWDSKTGELLYESHVPYKHVDPYGSSNPCIIHKYSYLYGISQGQTDTGGCCGPYELKNLKTKGPVEVEAEADESFHELCSQSHRDQAPKLTMKTIDGPANIRMRPNPKSLLVGVCKDKIYVSIVRTEGDWHEVQCHNYFGWTHKKNIRP